MTDQDNNYIYKLLPITSYKSERNLCSHLVRASKPQTLMFSDAGTFSCKLGRCYACKFVINCSAIHIKVPSDLLMTETNIPVFLKNIVYGIICKRVISFI